jgi:hypothetical protein
MCEENEVRAAAEADRQSDAAGGGASQTERPAGASPEATGIESTSAAHPLIPRGLSPRPVPRTRSDCTFSALWPKRIASAPPPAISRRSFDERRWKSLTRSGRLEDASSSTETLRLTKLELSLAGLFAAPQKDRLCESKIGGLERCFFVNC